MCTRANVCVCMYNCMYVFMCIKSSRTSLNGCEVVMVDVVVAVVLDYLILVLVVGVVVLVVIVVVLVVIIAVTAVMAVVVVVIVVVEFDVGYRVKTSG